MEKRWYDFDPTISLAINLLEKAESDIKKYCLNYIIEKAKDTGLVLDDDINNKFDCVWQRHTDSTLHFFEAMEYLKKADLNFQHSISLDVIKYVKELEKNIKDD